MKGSVFAILLAAFCRISYAGTLLNGGFEQINPDDPNVARFWEVDSNGVRPEIRQSFSTDELPYPSNLTRYIVPVDGNNFILLKSDERELLDPNFSRLSQKIHVRPGQRISGSYFFATGDYMPYDDTATITLIRDPCSNDPNRIVLVKKSVADVGSYQTMQGWARFVHDFNEADDGDYTLVIQVWDAVDHLFTSRFAVDAIKLECSYRLAGDFNGDCVVDFNDFSVLGTEWLSDCANLPCIANINTPPDGFVDTIDFSIMAENWMIDCATDNSTPACVWQPPPPQQEPPPQ
jgi:hypothetical protein